MRPLPRIARAFLRAERAAEPPPPFRPEDVGPAPGGAVQRVEGGNACRQQLAFIRDPARFKVACCSRRAGKTVAAAVLLLLHALASPGRTCLYVTLTRVSGKRIVWRTLLALNREFKLGGIPNRSELTLTLPNDAVVWVGGAKDEGELDKYRGTDRGYSVVVLDEAQAFPAFLEQFIDEVIEPAIIETKGTVVLIGTPGRVRSGYFYEALRHGAAELVASMNVQPSNDNDGDEERREHEWSVHHWTIRDNPFIPDVDDELARIRKRKRMSQQHPTYQREYLGRWVLEAEALVYKYDAERNGYDPATLAHGYFDAPDWQAVSFVDQGFDDADALGTLFFRKSEPWIWLLPDELVIRRQGSKALVTAAKERWERYKGRTIGFVWDTGGGGKKSAADAADEGVPVEAAKKDEKVDSIDDTNDLLLEGILRIPLNSQAAADASRTTWDPKARGVKISGKYHTDIWDGLIYGCRRIGRSAVLSMDEYRRRKALAEDPASKEEVERKSRIAARVRAQGAALNPRSRANRLLR